MSSINKSHVQVYSGEFIPGNNYKKWDIVEGPGVSDVFYYAKKDIVNGGGATINGYQGRFKITGQDMTISDQYENGFLLEGHKFDAGQVVQVTDDTHSENTNKFIIESVTPGIMTLDEIEGGESLVDSEVNSSIDITAIDQIPGASSSQLWSHKDFFFDPDYGSTVEFSTETSRFNYGDGYYSVQPNGINSVVAKFNLTFGNRTTREANSIIHFLENKLGQHEVDAPVDYLPYKQGMSGFFWDGASMFFPYNSTENLTKRFYCRDFSHSLVSENSNTVECTLENFDTSILRKSEQIWVERVDDYSPDLTYERDDVVFVSGVLGASHQFYYHSGEGPSTDVDPLQENSAWTREFYWAPSLGLNINETPRLKEAQFGSSAYRQIYNDGINESLLEIQLDFEGRREEEAKGILHFLETHLGTKSFSLTLPAPYNEKRRFIAPEWKHAYLFKDTHDISIKMFEFPFNFTDEEFDHVVAPTPFRGGDLSATPFVSMGMLSNYLQVDEKIGEKRRHRVYVKNIGDIPLNNITLSSAKKFVIGKGEREVFDQGSMDGVPFGTFNSSLWANTTLSNREKAVYDDDDYSQVRISANIANGPQGGLYFARTDAANGETLGTFFQSNQGNIYTKDSAHPASVPVLQNSSISLAREYINWNMINEVPWLPASEANTLLPGEECFFEIVFNPNSTVLDYYDDDGASLVYAAKFEVRADAGNTVNNAADVVVFAFASENWREPQLTQSRSTYGKSTINGTVTTRSETPSTNPYDGNDGAFDGKLTLSLDPSSFTATNLGPGAESVKQWGISRNGGSQWLMFNDLTAAEYSFTWKGISAGVQNIAVVDLVTEDMLSAEVTIPLTGPGHTAADHVEIKTHDLAKIGVAGKMYGG